MYKVLIVDDEERIRNGLTTIIDWEANHCKICGVAENGRNGIAKAKQLQPDLIIADIRMPGIDGLQMIEEIQEAGIFSHYIILSGAKDFQYAQRAIELKVAAYLLKPVNQDELLKKINLLFTAADTPPSDEPPIKDPADMVEKIMQYITDHYDRPLLLNVIAAEFHYSAPYFGRFFKKQVGESFHTHLERVRMEKAKSLLREGNKVYVVTKKIGYSNVDYFTDKFKAYSGMTPTEYRDYCINNR